MKTLGFLRSENTGFPSADGGEPLLRVLPIPPLYRSEVTKVRVYLCPHASVEREHQGIGRVCLETCCEL